MATGLTILQAVYGTEQTFTDVTKEVQAMVQDGSISFQVSAQSLGILDPAPGVKKTFQVKYTINGGKPTTLAVQDGDPFALDAPAVKQGASGPAGATTSFMGYVWYAMMVFFGVIYFFFMAGSAFSAGDALQGWTGQYSALTIGFLLLAFMTGGTFAFLWLPVGLFVFALFGTTIQWEKVGESMT
jgi:hypothetical protein